MATFEVKIKHLMNVNGDYIDRGLSIQISSMFANPLDEKEKVYKADLNKFKKAIKKKGLNSQKIAILIISILLIIILIYLYEI